MNVFVHLGPNIAFCIQIVHIKHVERLQFGVPLSKIWSSDLDIQPLLDHLGLFHLDVGSLALKKHHLSFIPNGISFVPLIVYNNLLHLID